VTRSRAKTRPATPADARNYLQKSKEFLRAASDSLELGNCTAAAGNAIHAGISAGDAISAVLIGTVSQGEHADAVGHLEKQFGGPVELFPAYWLMPHVRGSEAVRPWSALVAEESS
jgi:hypothetical protein